MGIGSRVFRVLEYISVYTYSCYTITLYYLHTNVWCMATWLASLSFEQVRTLIATRSYHFKIDILIIYIDNHDTASDFYWDYSISEVWYDIGIRIWYWKSNILYQKSDILYRKLDMISEVRSIILEVRYDIGSQIYYIGIPIWYKIRKKLCDYIVWLFDSNGTPYTASWMLQIHINNIMLCNYKFVLVALNLNSQLSSKVNPQDLVFYACLQARNIRSVVEHLVTWTRS